MVPSTKSIASCANALIIAALLLPVLASDSLANA